MDRNDAVSDKIYIRNLHLRCIVGVKKDERLKKQDIIVNTTLFTDLAAAAKSDDIRDTIDYSELKREIVATVEKSSHNLIEHIAEAIAGVCLRHEKVTRVRISVDKPRALRFARSVGVEIERCQK